MRAAGRFVVEAHGHITTLYKSKGQPPGDYFGGLTNTFSEGEVEYFDNSPLTLYDMEGNEKFSFGDGQIHFDPGSAALFLYDAANSVMRLPDVNDVARYAKLTHTLEHIEATSTALIPSEVPEEVSDIIRVYISCLFTDKPVVTGTFSEKGFAVMRDLLLTRTGRDTMRGAPCTIFDVCPTSPLRWSELGCHDLRECAQNAFPVQFISMPLPGAINVHSSR